MGVSWDDYLEMVRRVQRSPQAVGDGEAVSVEATLHDEIASACATMHPRPYIVHSRMDRPSTNSEGTPDFIVFMRKPTVVVVEAKTRTGKLSDAQQATRTWLSTLGWTVHVVRSLADFWKAVEAETNPPGVRKTQCHDQNQRREGDAGGSAASDP